MARKQSPADRQKRLDRGCCPIHGTAMTQIEPWQEQVGGPHDGGLYSVGICGVKGCGITAKAFDLNEPFELTPEWQYLLEENGS